jgi:hypothetical protein
MLFRLFARVVYREIKQNVPLQLVRKNFSSRKQWLFEFLARLSELYGTTLPVGFWHIWEARNDKHNSNDKPNPDRTSCKAITYIDMIRDQLFKTYPKQRCDSNLASPKWIPPPSRSVLVTSDVAIFEVVGCMATGVVIRNDHIFLMACRGHLNGTAPPEYAEALALRQVVTLARNDGFNKVFLLQIVYH